MNNNHRKPPLSLDIKQQSLKNAIVDLTPFYGRNTDEYPKAEFSNAKHNRHKSISKLLFTTILFTDKKHRVDTFSRPKFSNAKHNRHKLISQLLFSIYNSIFHKYNIYSMTIRFTIFQFQLLKRKEVLNANFSLYSQRIVRATFQPSLHINSPRKCLISQLLYSVKLNDILLLI